MAFPIQTVTIHVHVSAIQGVPNASATRVNVCGMISVNYIPRIVAIWLCKLNEGIISLRITRNWNYPQAAGVYGHFSFG